MAAFVLTDVELLWGQARLACVANQAAVMAESSEQDATTFCSGGWTTLVAGRDSATISAAGPQDFAAAAVGTPHLLDEAVAAAGGIGAIMPFSAVPLDAGETSVAYATNAVLLGYTPVDATPGELAVQQANWKSVSALVRGVYATKATITATGTGTIHNFGAVTATQRIWAAVHFLTAQGTTPSITVRVESAPTVGFAAPTTRATLTAQTGRGAQWVSALGPVTDTFWRLAWTVSGTTPSFDVRGVLAIQ